MRQPTEYSADRVAETGGARGQACGLSALTHHIVKGLNAATFPSQPSTPAHNALLQKFKDTYNNPNLTWDTIKTLASNQNPKDQEITFHHPLREFMVDQIRGFKNTDIGNGLLTLSHEINPGTDYDTYCQDLRNPDQSITYDELIAATKELGIKVAIHTQDQGTWSRNARGETIPNPVVGLAPLELVLDHNHWTYLEDTSQAARAHNQTYSQRASHLEGLRDMSAAIAEVTRDFAAIVQPLQSAASTPERESANNPPQGNTQVYGNALHHGGPAPQWAPAPRGRGPVGNLPRPGPTAFIGGAQQRAQAARGQPPPRPIHPAPPIGVQQATFPGLRPVNYMEHIDDIETMWNTDYSQQSAQNQIKRPAPNGPQIASVIIDSGQDPNTGKKINTIIEIHEKHLEIKNPIAGHEEQQAKAILDMHMAALRAKTDSATNADIPPNERYIQVSGDNAALKAAVNRLARSPEYNLDTTPPKPAATVRIQTPPPTSGGSGPGI